MTISPPAKARTGEYHPIRVLSCGLDTLHLSFYVTWVGDLLPTMLHELKALAIEREEPAPGLLPVLDDPPFLFTTASHGMKGYEWLIDSREFRMDLGAWKEPKSRPSPLVFIGSESLWHTGADAIVDRVRRVLVSGGADIAGDKVSRVDLCVDVLMPESCIGQDLEPLLVTRAAKVSRHNNNGKLTGYTIGTGAVSCRIYDKPLEIATKSGKTFFYDVWGLATVPDECRIIRVEFQLRREAIKQLGIDSYADLQSKHADIWRYCTESWLKVCDHPERHVARRHVLPWWQVVQAGYTGVQGATPAVRTKAIHADRDSMVRAIAGYLSSHAALSGQWRDLKAAGMVTITGAIRQFFHDVQALGVSDEAFTLQVQQKLAKYRIPDHAKPLDDEPDPGMIDVPF